MKNLIRVILLLFVGVSIAFLAKGSFTKEEVKSKPSDTQSSSATPHKVIAYYFHGNARCMSCKRIEAWSAEAINTGFVDALKQGSLEWKPLNVEEPGNEHFVNDFKLYTKSLVIVEMKDGQQIRWKNLDKVWQLLRDESAFLSYVQSEVAEYLKEG